MNAMPAHPSLNSNAPKIFTTKFLPMQILNLNDDKI